MGLPPPKRSAAAKGQLGQRLLFEALDAEAGGEDWPEADRWPPSSAAAGPSTPSAAAAAAGPSAPLLAPTAGEVTAVEMTELLAGGYTQGLKDLGQTRVVASHLALLVQKAIQHAVGPRAEQVRPMRALVLSVVQATIVNLQDFFANRGAAAGGSRLAEAAAEALQHCCNLWQNACQQATGFGGSNPTIFANSAAPLLAEPVMLKPLADALEHAAASQGASWVITCRSVVSSSATVGSSSSTTRGRASTRRASSRHWRCPPERPCPPSRTG
mgnify:CR=1 FL=1